MHRLALVEVEARGAQHAFSANAVNVPYQSSPALIQAKLELPVWDADLGSHLAGSNL